MAARRDLLAAGAAALLGGCTTASLGAHARRDPADDPALLEAALALELQAIGAYRKALDAGGLQGAERALAESFLADHRAHAEALTGSFVKRRGAPPPRTVEDGYSSAGLADRATALAFLRDVEKGLAGAQLGAVPAYVDRDLAKQAAGIMAVEAMHLAALRQALGEAPVPAPIIG